MKNLADLTEEQILKDIEPFKSEWLNDCDWWYGSTLSFKNATYGYDVNIFHNEDTGAIEAIIYNLIFIEKKGKYDQSKLEIANEPLFKFEIKVEEI